MAANFWHSAHFKKWIIDKSELELATQQDITVLSKYEYMQMKLFYSNGRNLVAYSLVF